jgi:hypothetical protein
MKTFSPFGYIEVCSNTKHTACVAVDNQISANIIQTAFKDDQELEISLYDFWKHNNYLRKFKLIGGYIHMKPNRFNSNKITFFS